MDVHLKIYLYGVLANALFIVGMEIKEYWERSKEVRNYKGPKWCKPRGYKLKITKNYVGRIILVLLFSWAYYIMIVGIKLDKH